MAFVPAPGVAEFALIFSSYGNEQVNVLDVHHKDAAAFTTGDLIAVNNAIINWWNTSGQPMCATDFGIVEIRARDMSTQFGNEVTTGVNTPGTRAGTALPENATLAIKKDTGLAGRSFRGRLYHIGLTKTDVSGDRVVNATVIALVASYQSLLGAINGIANTELVIVHTQINKVVQNPRTTTPVVRFTTTDNVVDSQKRRLIAHNSHR